MSLKWDMSGNDLVVDTITGSDSGLASLMNLTLTSTTAGASVDGAYFTTETEVALGTYANAINGKLDFGTAGRVTGLGGVICAELDLGPGTTQGSYACFEAELNLPSGAKTGARTSVLSVNVWGQDAATFSTNGNLLDMGGITISANNIVQASAVANIDSTHALRININGTPYFIPLHTGANFGG